jgi:5-methylthioribose kinase
MTSITPHCGSVVAIYERLNMEVVERQGYRPLNADTLGPYLAQRPAVAAQLGGNPSEWTITEEGDGNLNLVFMVRGPAGRMVAKQALPYARVVGESWPLTLERSFFEAQALKIQSRYAPQHLPEVYFFDHELALIGMEYLHPHVIMRKGVVEGVQYPLFAEHIATFLAETLFRTSDLCLAAAEKKEMMSTFCKNVELCKITEDLIFTDPYYLSDNNRWTSPQLDDIAETFRTTGAYRIAISELKERFLCVPQALLHGDLHTGSIMLTQSDTRVIDPEFAFYGPIGFDVGILLANLLMGYFAREDEWLLEQTEQIWTQFKAKFLQLWETNHTGDLWPARAYDIDDTHSIFQDRYIARIFNDTVGYTGAEITRRILGLAHAEELESISDPDHRAICERQALTLAGRLLTERTAYKTIDEVTAHARQLKE